MHVSGIYIKSVLIVFNAHIKYDSSGEREVRVYFLTLLVFIVIALQLLSRNLSVSLIFLCRTKDLFVSFQTANLLIILLYILCNCGIVVNER